MSLKKILYNILLIFGLISNVSCSDNILVVYTEVGFAPFEYINDGKIVGVDVDIMNLVGKKLGKKVVFENVSFDIIVDIVAEGKVANVGAAGLSITEKRLKKIDFSNPYYTANLYVIYNANNVDYNFSRIMSDNKLGVYWSTLNSDKGIGVLSGTTADYFLSDEIENCDALKNTKKCDYDMLDTAIADIGLNIDYVIIDELPARKLVENKEELECLPLYYNGDIDEAAYDEYAIGVTKGQTVLLDTINEVLDELLVEDENGFTTIDKMVSEHLGVDNI